MVLSGNPFWIISVLRIDQNCGSGRVIPARLERAKRVNYNGSHAGKSMDLECNAVGVVFRQFVKFVTPLKLLSCRAVDTGEVRPIPKATAMHRESRIQALHLRRTGIADNDCPRGSRFSIEVGWAGHSCQDSVFSVRKFHAARCESSGPSSGIITRQLLHLTHISPGKPNSSASPPQKGQDNREPADASNEPGRLQCEGGHSSWSHGGSLRLIDDPFRSAHGIDPLGRVLSGCGPVPFESASGLSRYR